MSTSQPEHSGMSSEAGQSQPGDTLGRYRLLKKIARGGMAEVFAARSFGAHGFEKTVAIKRILPRYGQDPQFVRMMVDEAKITVLLNHPNVANIVELCEQDGDYFIVMEFVPGQSLSSVVKKLRERGERFGALEASFIVVELLQGLHAAHVQKDASGNIAHIIHRDVSPQNVLLSFDGHVKVIDFGIARARHRLEMTEIGTIKGKLRYLAPEMIDPARFMKTGDFDHRVDVFAAGIVLWELIANRTLYQGDDEMVVYDSITDSDAPDLQKLGFCDAALAKIATKALTRDPEKRYLNAEDFADDLRAYVYRTDPAFTHKRIAQVMEKAFPLEKEELLSLERGQYQSTSGPNKVASGAPPAPKEQTQQKPSSAHAQQQPDEVVRIPADAETRTQHVSGGPHAPVNLANAKAEPTKQMRTGDSNKRLPGAGKNADLPERKAPGQGDVLTVMTLVSKTSGVRRKKDAADFAAQAETLTSADAMRAAVENETPYTSESLRSLPRRKRAMARRSLVLLSAASAAGIALIIVVALWLSRPPEPEPIAAKHVVVKAVPVRVVVQSETPKALASALNVEVPIPAVFSALPGDSLAVTVRAPGFREKSIKVDVPLKDARDQVIDVSLSAADVALNVVVKPPDATVVVGNDPEMKPYVEGMTITPNVPTMVQVSAPGFATVKREVLAKVGEPLDVEIDLTPFDDPRAKAVHVDKPEKPDKPEKVVEKRAPPPPSQKTATLVLKTKDMWGQVTIDGKTYEETTPLTVELKPGKHNVTVAHPPKGLKKSFVITLKPGESQSKMVVFD